MKLYVISVGKAVHYVVRWQMTHVLITREKYQAFALQFARDAAEGMLTVRQRSQRCYLTRKQKLCKR